MTEQDPVPPRRDELMAPYRRPFRHTVPRTWAEHDELRRAAFAGVAVTILGAIGVLAGAALLALTLWCGVLIGAVAAVLLVVNAGTDTLALRRRWSRKSELRDVLARRPQAGTEDPDLAHDLFAVTVEDDGWLLTWRFRPLTLDAQPGPDEVEVPGRPRYAAQAIEDRAFAVEDAALAAEQLVEAQDRAAEREAGAAAAAHRAIEAAHLSDERAIEARSTAAALQRTTGQRSRDD